MIMMKNIVKTFGTQRVLDNINFEVADGEVFGLLGPSGSGKTTIINILSKLINQDEGEHTTGASSLETGLMLEHDGLYGRLTCQQNLDLFAGIYNVDKSKVQQALDSVGLGDAAKKPVAKLSKGMRQRLALARAILHAPKVLFLDEPTSALDPNTALGIHDLILGLKAAGTTIFLTTHNMDEAVALCDNVALLHKGNIVEYGNPVDICKKHDSFKTVPDLESVFIKLTGTTKEELKEGAK
ncbi:MAG: ABC transporter ATP-binding protein [Defluviitaleaceae bacterium]|nr:ABC transporter ATP-binding protein [Defluviitaleaceae bacterium]